MLILISTLLLTTIALNLFVGWVVWHRHLEFTFVTNLFVSFLCFDALWAGGILFVINQPAGTYGVGSVAYLSMQTLFGAVCVWNLLKLIFYKKVFVAEPLFARIGDYVLAALFAVSTIGAIVPHGLFGEIIVSGTGYADLTRTGVNAIFSAYILYSYGYAIFVLQRKRATLKSVLLRQQTTWLLWSHTIFLGLSITTNLVLSNLLHIYYFNALGPAFTLFSLAIYAHLIQRYRLFDIRIGLHRALTYATSALVLGSLLAGIVLNLPQSNPYLLLIANAATLLTLVVAAVPFTRWVSDVFGHYIFGANGSTISQLTRLTGTIAGMQGDLHEAYRQTMAGVIHALGLESCAFVPVAALPSQLTGSAANTLFHGRMGLYVDELDSRAEAIADREAEAIAGMLKAEEVAVLQPVRENGRLIGALRLGAKHTGAPFTADELDAIAAIADDVKLFLAGATAVTPAQPEVAIGSLPEHRLRLHDRAIDQLSLIVIEADVLAGMPRLPPIARTTAERIQRCAFAVSRLHHNFSYLDRNTADIPLDMSGTHIITLVQSVIAALPALYAERYAAPPQYRITLRRTPQSDWVVLGADAFIREGLNELLINALRYAEGPIILEFIDHTETLALRLTHPATLTTADMTAMETPFTTLPRHRELAGDGLGITVARHYLAAARATVAFQKTRTALTTEVTFLPLHIT